MVSASENVDSLSVVLDVEGMMCGACVARVRNVLKSQPNVESVAVNMLTETAVVRLSSSLSFHDSFSSANLLASRLTECGFPSKKREATEDRRSQEKILDLAKKREISLSRSNARVAFAWTLVALCCGTHATHWLHSLGIHFAGHGKTITFILDDVLCKLFVN